MKTPTKSLWELSDEQLRAMLGEMRADAMLFNFNDPLEVERRDTLMNALEKILEARRLVAKLESLKTVSVAKLRLGTKRAQP